MRCAFSGALLDILPDTIIEVWCSNVLTDPDLWSVSGAIIKDTLEVIFPASFEESLLSPCAPCSCWPTTISGCDHALQASTPSDHL